jgi:alpha-tubulin suppressor-like RCC1 family protein
VLGVTDATQVVAGYDNCVLHADATVSCWGAGIFYNPPQPTPTPMPGLAAVQTLTLGDSHVCALMTSGTVACWGDNQAGQLGIDPGTPTSTVPVAVPGLADIVEVAAGGSSTCARRSDGEVLCWGGNLPGDGSMTPSAVPVQVRW